ncbi:cupredoxin domain-containing protein [Andreprevotia chitinilytica]|uniref:cupredoxin domain-containing protein n=1 Tax=Andreprevotia chitinilytica TaxID=396808 RepID=UPI000A04676F|nr:cupredoxin domain-containing protein [Andreprevotia chitinilytica]
MTRNSFALGMAGVVLALAAIAPVAQAADLPTFKITLKDGVMTPARIEAPANTRFKLEITNAGKSPAEFESISLRKEKVLGPGVTSFVVVNPTSPAEHVLFDDFHPQAKGLLVIK